MMGIAARQSTSLIAFTLPGTPFSARMARFYIRAALDYHDLGGYAEDIETVASELVSNAITHAGAPSFGLELLRLEDSGAVAVVVTDPCPRPPTLHHPAEGAEHGRGLVLVEALSANWG
jgi:anti-sigma regulatory factor (Ser/Thr protein kinase)